MTLSKLVFLPLVCLVSATINAQEPLNSEQTYNSGVEKNTLIELYTSEGCSSCPPADRWLSSLKSNDKLWNDLIPIAFHVDYWDYIGWEDPYADPKYSQRQRRYAREKGENTVYTPGLKANGYPWLSWRRGGLAELESDAENVGNLALNVFDGGKFTANFEAADADTGANAQTLNIAVLGMGIVNQVERGENRGKELKHDFVVLAHKTFDSNSDKTAWQGTLPVSDISASEYAIAAWVAPTNSLSPIQAVAGSFER